MAKVTRQVVVDVVQERLRPLDFVLALWEAGSAAFGRVDEWSDVDLMIVVEDGREAEAFAVLEAALAALSPIELVYEMAQPTWHGHQQKFYRLREASEFLMIDVAVMARSSGDKFLTVELHGEARVLFDKEGVVRPPLFDGAAHQERLRGRLREMAGLMPLLGNLVRKELLRGQPLDALSFYQGLILRPLVELLRIKYDPARHQFGARYLYHDLPPAETERLERLMFVSSPDALLAQQVAALEWFWELVEEMKERYDLSE